MSIYHINWCRIFSITLSTEFNWDARKKGSLQVPMPMRESNVHHWTLVFQWSFHQVTGAAKGKQPWFFLQESKPRVSNITWKSPKITVSDLDRLSLVVYPSYLPWTFHCILGNKSNLCPSTPNMGLLFFQKSVATTSGFLSINHCKSQGARWYLAEEPPVINSWGNSPFPLWMVTMAKKHQHQTPLKTHRVPFFSTRKKHLFRKNPAPASASSPWRWFDDLTHVGIFGDKSSFGSLKISTNCPSHNPVKDSSRMILPWKPLHPGKLTWNLKMNP